MAKRYRYAFVKKVTATMLALACTFSLCQVQPMTVKAEEESTQSVLEAGTYQVPIQSLVSAAPLPAVQTAFAGAFGDSVLLEVAEDGSMKATANCQNMVINLGLDYYANILTVENAVYNTYKTEKSSLAFGSAETEDKEVPDEITFPLELNESGSTVLTITVDFMNNFLGGGSDYPTDVTLTLDFDNAQKVATEVELTQGTYDVDVALYHATKDQLSMAAGALTGKAKISVKDDVATMYLYTQELSVYGVTAYMQGIKVQNADGTYTEGKLVSQDADGNPTCYSFTLPSTDEFLNVLVSEMGRDMDARLKVDYTTLNKTSDEPIAEETDGDDNGDNSGDNSGDNGDNGSDSGDSSGDNGDNGSDSDDNSGDNGDNGSNSGDNSGDSSDNGNDSTDNGDDTDADELTDGTYKVSVSLYHATKDQLSMAASAILKEAKLVVKDGTTTMILYTQPMTFGSITASLQELKVADLDGNYTDAKVIKKDTDGNPTAFSFVLPHTESYLTLKVNPHVAMMGNVDLDARLFVDYTTLKKVSSSDTTDKDTTDSDTTKNDTTTDNTTDSNTTTDTTTTTDATTTTTTTTTTTSSEITVADSDSWAQVKTSIDAAAAQGTVTVKLSGTTVVAGSVLDALKGQDKNLVVQLENGAFWTINGTKITGSNFADIDLGVTLHADNIPDGLVNGVAKNGTGSLELSLNHEGEFGFEGTLTVALGSEYAGQYANLYYYNKAAGKMELVGSYAIDANGNAALTFTHASDYVIVMDQANYSVSAPKTGDETNMAIPLCILATGIFAAGIAAKRYQKRRYSL